jgi:hypothetical protein
VYLPDESNAPSAPASALPNIWQQYDAGASGSAWYATDQQVANEIGCTHGNPCSFAVLKAQLR